MEAREGADALIDRARKQFETNGAPWTDRTEAAIRNVVTPLIMDRDAAVLSPEHVRIVRTLVKGAIADFDRIGVLGAIGLAAQARQLHGGADAAARRLLRSDREAVLTSRTEPELSRVRWGGQHVERHDQTPQRGSRMLHLGRRVSEREYDPACASCAWSLRPTSILCRSRRLRGSGSRSIPSSCRRTTGHTAKEGVSSGACRRSCVRREAQV
jgi:hypothetical protein